jgi:hypothetical protein
MSLSGPMFEPAKSVDWESSHGKQGGHYNTFHLAPGADAMDVLHHWFPDGEANEMNLVFFSTSGVHGTYCTIEEVETGLSLPGDHEDRIHDLTFLVVQPRIVTLRYGNCTPKTPDDFAFLKKLRASSWAAAQKIGSPEAE